MRCNRSFRGAVDDDEADEGIGRDIREWRWMRSIGQCLLSAPFHLQMHLEVIKAKAEVMKKE